MNEKIAYIHTGFHKAGSSSIQHTLAHNRVLLAKHGITYPEFSIKGIQFYNQSVPLFGLYCETPGNFSHYGLQNGLDATTTNQEINHFLESSIFGKNKLIFSDEFISTLSEPALTNLRDDFKSKGYRLKVISYIREPFSKLVSHVQQRSRVHSINWTLTTHDPQNEAKKIIALTKVFEKDAKFYSFEKACSHRLGPVGFLLSLLNINAKQIALKRINTGMSTYSVRALSAINQNIPLTSPSHKVATIRERDDVHLLTNLPGEKYSFYQEELRLAKPMVLESRIAISKLLGDDFLPPVKFTYTDKIVWSTQQLEHIIKVSPHLDLAILIKLYDFLSTESLKDSATKQLLDHIALSARKRLNQELAIQRLKEKIKLPFKQIKKIIF